MKSKKKKVVSKKIKKIVFFGTIFSNLLILSGVIIIFLTFGKPFSAEFRYRKNQLFGIHYKVFDPQTKEKAEESSGRKDREIIPESLNFGIVIPKINANAKIFPNVDPFNSQEFLPVLRKGVAHAKGTSFPDQGKNIYLFAHSTDAFFNAGQYNAVFYLLGKLENGDEIDIFYHNELFKYEVFEKKVVQPSAVKYLRPENEEILTLQTCYPPGTTLERLIIRARKIKI